jgi:hypothetical protein
VTNALGLSPDTPLHRQSPPPRKAGQGISFTLDPARSTGDSLTAAAAQARFCNLNRSVGD